MHSSEFNQTTNMMKLAFAVVAVLALSASSQAWQVPRTGNGALADELQDFVNIIPLDDMLNVVMEYLADDAEFQKLVNYLLGPEFKALIADVEAMPEVLDLLNYIQGAGVDAYALVNKVNQLLGLKDLTPPARFATLKISGGIRGCINDIKALYPQEKVKALFDKKMASSPVFQDLMKHLSSPQFQQIAEKVCANPHFKDLLAEIKKDGIDAQLVKTIIERILGVKLNCDV